MHIDLIYIAIFFSIVGTIALCYLLKKLLSEDNKTCKFIEILYALSSSIKGLNILELIVFTFILALIILSTIILSVKEEYQIDSFIISSILVAVVIIIALIWKYKDKELDKNYSLERYKSESTHAEQVATAAVSVSDLGDNNGNN